MQDGGWAKILGFVLGIVYVLCIGFGNWPQHAQVTIFSIAALFSLSTLVYLRQKRLSIEYRFLSSAFLLFAFFSSITSNHLVIFFNQSTLLISFSLLLLFRFEHYHFPDTAQLFVKSFGNYILSYIRGLFTHEYVQHFFSIQLTPKINREQGTKWATAILACLPILLLFHFLFANVNSEYSEFMIAFFDPIWRFIKYLFEIDFIWKLFQIILSSYLFYVGLRISSPQKKTEQDRSSQAWIAGIIIFLSIILFAVFEVFQSKLLFFNFSQLPFKEVSLYVQKGFWELVAVALIGYSLCLFALHEYHKEATKRTTLLYALYIFTLELIGIAIFSFHKVATHQNIFGLKDQRILASVGIGLILITFICFLLRLKNIITAAHIFKLQVSLLLISMIILNVINVDLLVSRIHPVRYFVEERAQLDYGYLLGNSYDNYSAWPQLLSDITTDGFKAPQEEYYWGNYRSLCVFMLSGSRINEAGRRASTSFADHVAQLEKKYGSFGWGSTLPQITQFNFNEYQAYQLYRQNKNVFTQYMAQIETLCLSQ